jgi:hypothetical protein
MSCLGGWYQWRWGEVGREVGKGSERVNVVQTLGTHVCKLKNETC